MKKKLRAIPLATAAFLAMGMSAVSAQTVYYETGYNTGKFVQAELEGLDKNANAEQGFLNAQNGGWKIFVKEDNGTIVNWQKALNAGVSYSAAVTTPAYNTGNTAPTNISKTVDEEGNETTVGNKTPVVVEEMNDVEGQVGEAIVVNDLGAHFSDEDGDTLTYTATSSNTAVATVKVEGKKLTVTPVKDGTAVITVTANDGKASVSTTFTVTVGEQQSGESQTIKITAAGATQVSGSTELLDLTASKVQNIMPGVNLAKATLKTGLTTDGLKATVTYVKNGETVTVPMNPNGPKNAFTLNIDAATEATITVEKEQAVQLDVIDVAASKVQNIMPGVNLAKVVLKAPNTTDGFSATIKYIKNGETVTASMNPNGPKNAFTLNIDAAVTGEVTVTGQNGSQTITINQ